MKVQQIQPNNTNFKGLHIKKKPHQEMPFTQDLLFWKQELVIKEMLEAAANNFKYSVLYPKLQKAGLISEERRYE